MNNDSQKISANEINKYVYCPYQWYYERLYGTAHIRGLYKKRNAELGLEDSVFSNFNKGLDFHKSFKYRKSFGHFVKWILYFIAMILGIALAIWIYGNFSQSVM